MTEAERAELDQVTKERDLYRAAAERWRTLALGVHHIRDREMHQRAAECLECDRIAEELGAKEVAELIRAHRRFGGDPP